MATSPTILLVDDEESIQKLLRYPLERDGYRVVQARDGEEAVQRFRGKVVGLEIGADDYITKPFSIREFRSRVKAHLRRARLGQGPPPDERIEVDGLAIDVA